MTLTIDDICANVAVPNIDFGADSSDYVDIALLGSSASQDIKLIALNDSGSNNSFKNDFVLQLLIRPKISGFLSAFAFPKKEPCFLPFLFQNNYEGACIRFTEFNGSHYSYLEPGDSDNNLKSKFSKRTSHQVKRVKKKDLVGAVSQRTEEMVTLHSALEKKPEDKDLADRFTAKYIELASDYWSFYDSLFDENDFDLAAEFPESMSDMRAISDFLRSQIETKKPKYSKEFKLAMLYYWIGSKSDISSLAENAIREKAGFLDYLDVENKSEFYDIVKHKAYVDIDRGWGTFEALKNLGFIISTVGGIAAGLALLDPTFLYVSTGLYCLDEAPRYIWSRHTGSMRTPGFFGTIKTGAEYVLQKGKDFFSEK